jgi:hypothetical protein
MEEIEEYGIDVSYFGNITVTWDVPNVNVQYYFFYNE